MCTFCPPILSWHGLAYEGNDARRTQGQIIIDWTLTETLEYHDFSDDVVLLSHRFSDVQSKSRDLARNPGKTTVDGDSEVEVKARMSKARGVLASLNSIWKRSNISLKTKVHIFRRNVLSVLLYGAEPWKVTKWVCQKLKSCLPKILIPILDHITDFLETLHVSYTL